MKKQLFPLAMWCLWVLPGTSLQSFATVRYVNAGVIAVKKPAIRPAETITRTCDQAVYDFAVIATGIPIPTLGTYPPTSLIAGQNAVITPSAAPTNATSIVAYTNTSFTGVLAVNPITGVLTVTKALQAGVYAVTVKAASTTTAFILTVTNPTCSQGTFGGTTDVAVGVQPRSVAVGDFNGDGRQDIATANFGSASVSIRLGDGLGGFSGTTNVGVGTVPYSVAVGDFNGDGRQDIAAANFGDNTVSIRLGDGAGGFSGTTEVGVGLLPVSVAVGDFNGDGRQDFAAANYIDNTVSIRLGDGAGGFSGTTEVGVGSLPVSVAVGDFNGDGRQDVATTNLNSGTVSIRLGDGTGGFSGTTNVAVGTQPVSVAVGDFNGDGRQDVAVANAISSGTVSIRLGDGAGGFSGTTNVAVGAFPYSVAVGDFNGDGRQDVAAANVVSGTVSIRLGDGAGGFSGTTNVAVGNNPYSVAVGDFNGDGRQDFAAANFGSNTVSIRPGGIAEINLQGGSPLANIPDGDIAPTTAKGTDFGNVNVTGNSAKTFTIQNTGTGPLTISSITSNNALFTVGGLTLPATITAGGSATFTVTFSPTATGVQNATLTLNNDDCDEAVYDFAVTATGIPIPTLSTYPPTSLIAGQNAVITPSAAPTNATSIVAYTNNNTNTPFTGILAVNPTTGVLTVTKALQAGVYAVTVKAASTTTAFTLTVTNPTCSQGTFSGTTNVGVGVQPRSVAVGDFNGDGRQDIATANLSNNNVSIRLGDGLGGFSGTNNVGVGSLPVSVAIGDFNGDGRQDVAAANSVNNSVSIRLGDGLGGFSGTTDVAVENNPRSVAVGDFNGDGRQDFAVANAISSGTVSIRLGDGLGGFSGTTNVAVGSLPVSVAVGDFNGDGRQDFAAANANNDNVSIRLGDGLGGFSGTTNVAVGSLPVSVAVGDFNGDGWQDIAAANYGSDNVSIRLGNGAGGFNPTTDVTVGTAPYSVAVGDFNGDGRQDVATANYGSDNVSIRLGDGAGGFSPTTDVAVESQPYSVAVGDFNGDGRQDVATANSGSNSVSIRLGVIAEINLQSGSPLDPTTCGGTGSIPFTTTNLADGMYTLNYKRGTTDQTAGITVASNAFTLSGLTQGSYSEFSITNAGCTGSDPTTKTLTDPAKPTLMLGTIQDICASTMSFAIPYSNPLESPNQYSISGTGITTVNNGSLTNPIIVHLSSPAAGSSLTFNLRVKNSTTACVSDNILGSVAVNPVSLGGTVGNAQTICTGTSPADLILSNQVGNIVKWQKSSNLNFTDPTNISGTSTTLTSATIGNLTTTTYFRAVVKNSVCSEANSSPVLVTVAPQPVGPAINVKTPNTDAICFGSTVSATFNAGSGGVGCLDDFIVSIDGANPVAYTPGSNVGATATTSILIQGRRANCSTGLGCNGTDYTPLASWTVNPLPTASILNNSSPFCAGANAAFTLNGTNGATLTYTLTGLTGNQTLLLDGTNQTITINNAPSDITLTLLSVTKNNCPVMLSATATVTVYPLPTDFALSGGGISFCQTPLSIVTAGSQSGVAYQLKRNNVNLGNPIEGTGNPLSFSGLTQAGTYTVVATTVGNCSRTLSTEITIQTCNAPNAYNLTGGGASCSGTPVSITLSNSQIGVLYQLKRANNPVGNPVPGTGNTLNFPAQNTPGNYTVVALTQCADLTMNNTVSITSVITPSTFTVTGGGISCGTALPVGLSDSQSVVFYQLYRNGSPVGTSVQGTGQAISLGNHLTPGQYTIVATRAGECPTIMSGSVSITLIDPPALFTVTGGGAACPGGVSISLSGSQIGIQYQLKRNNVNIGSPLSGTGNPLSFDNQTVAGTYTVEAISEGNCTRIMSGNAIVTAAGTLPNVYSMTGGGPYCNNAVALGLSDSQKNVSYQLQRNTPSGFVNVGTSVQGTGSALALGTHSILGEYRVVVNSACVTEMSGRKSITPCNAREASEPLEGGTLTGTTVSPNPVTNILHLKVSEAKGQKVNVILLDASGRALLQRAFVPESNQHQEEFEVSEIAAGMYFLKVNAGDKQTTLKVVKVE